MNTIVAEKARPYVSRWRGFWNYLSLFGSLSTLLCCALPSLLVLFGLGATVASLLSAMPWLVSLSRHKNWVFFISGGLIGLSFLQAYYISPKLQAACAAGDPSACATASRVSRVLLWLAALIFAVGFFVAYVLGPILAYLDAIS
jgi:hypothetical protein